LGQGLDVPATSWSGGGQDKEKPRAAGATGFFIADRGWKVGTTDVAVSFSFNADMSASFRDR
jgi:hypothetical protein